ncbi:MAG: sigma-E factor negative regulatory protein [Herminiimonas sp.]|nr:sigma-E factor negative regulatory protein [Herminiimonas sp.]
MNTKNMTQEQISAFSDGELADIQVDVMLASLSGHDERAAWTTYHEIGDMLRSDDLDVDLTSDFSTRLMARLDAEPPLALPIVRKAHEQAADTAGTRTYLKRFGLPAFSATAALAVIGFAAVPQLMVASTDAGRTAPAMVAVASQDVGNALKTPIFTSSKERALRDPRIDDYLLAHQRFSPSVYSTAQYARSATFATETDK